MAKVVIEAEDQERIDEAAEMLRLELLDHPAGKATTAEAWRILVDYEIEVFRQIASVVVLANAVADAAPSLGLRERDGIKINRLHDSMLGWLEPPTDRESQEHRIVIWDSMPPQAMSEAEDLLRDSTYKRAKQLAR